MPSEIFTALPVATIAKATTNVIATQPISIECPSKNGMFSAVQPSFTEKNQPNARPNAEIIANFTGARSPATAFLPNKLITSSIKPIKPPPTKAATGIQVCSRIRQLHAKITVGTVTKNTMPAIVGKCLFIFFACSLFITVNSSPVIATLFCFFHNLCLYAKFV